MNIDGAMTDYDGRRLMDGLEVTTCAESSSGHVHDDINC